MKNKPKLYHFIEPKFGYEIVNYYFNNKLHEKVDIILIISKRIYFPKRKTLNPLKAYDYFSFYNYKRKIKKEFSHFGYKIKFLSDVNHSYFRNSISEKSFGLSTGFNQIFKVDLIEKFDRLINLHPSVLPLYKGPTPIMWCKHYQENNSGWTIHEIDEKIDHGEILYQNQFNIEKITRDQILALVCDSAKKIILEIIIAELEGKLFTKKILDCHKIYQNKITYLSHYKDSKQQLHK